MRRTEFHNNVDNTAFSWSDDNRFIAMCPYADLYDQRSRHTFAPYQNSGRLSRGA